jgi:hypothetical protein
MQSVVTAGALLFVWAIAGAAETSATSQAVDILALLREFGFPIFVCVWFMWRLEKRIERFAASIEKLYAVNMVLAKAVDDKPVLPSGD